MQPGGNILPADPPSERKHLRQRDDDDAGADLEQRLAPEPVHQQHAENGDGEIGQRQPDAGVAPALRSVRSDATSPRKREHATMPVAWLMSTTTARISGTT